jgi:NADPH:quinone reductase-like Zn-dependent oxidoreductase
MPENENGVLAVEYDAYGGPEVLKLRRIAPPKPAAGEVLVQVRTASMNPVDWKIRSGMLQKFFPVTFPAITGRDGAGDIIAAAPDVDVSCIGTRVCFVAPRGVGTWAEQIALPASLTAPIPARLSIEEAAALPLAGTSAWVALVQTAKIAAGMRVLIHAAAGGVGSLAVQIARACGASVVATCSARNVEFVRDLGADDVIAYDKIPFEQKARDVDVVLDVMGGDVHRRSYQVLKRGGMMVCLAAAPYEDQGARYGVKVELARVMPDGTSLAAVVDLAAAGKITPRVEHVMPFSDFAKVQEMSQSGHARGKTVLAMPSK